MTQRLRRSIAAALIVLSLPILATLAIVVIANTESGTRWAIDKAAAMVPGTLEAGDFEGTLWSGVRFAELSYQDDDRDIDAAGLELRFDLLALFARRVAISDLTVNSIAYRDLAATSDSPVPLDLETQALPVTIVVERGRVREFLFAGRDETRVEAVTIDEGWFDGRRIRVARAAATTQDVSIAITNASLLLDGQVALTAALRWQMADDEWSGHGSVRGTLLDMQFNQVVNGPYPATVSGVVAPFSPSGPVVDALVNWEHWTIGGRGADDGEARVRGWLDGYTLQFNATVQAMDELRVAVRGDASGTTERFESFQADLESAQGSAKASGSLEWEPRLLLRADLHAIDADANALLPGLAGRISGDARLRYDDAGVLGIDSQLSVGDNRLRANGTLAADVMSIAIDFDVARIDAMTDAVTGSATGSGTLSGTLAAPVLDLNLHGHGIRVGADPAPALAVALSGRLRQLDSSLVGTINEASVAEPTSGSWSLSQPTEMRIGDSKIAIAPHAWSGTHARIRVDRVEFGRDTTTIVAVISDVSLSLADAWFPADISLVGTAEAGIDLVRSGGLWSGIVTWDQDDTILRVTGPTAEPTEVRIPQASAKARLDSGAVTAEADLAVEPGVSARLEMELASLSRNADVSANLRLQGNNWSWVSAVVPQIDRFDGALAASISATGTLDAPDLSGTLEWQYGSLLVPFLNVPFDDIEVVVTGDRHGAATLAGSARAGDGSLSASGRFTDLMRRSRSLHLRVQGEAAELLNWPEYRVWATPDIEITVDRSEWRIDGEVTMPRADIVVRKLPEEAVTISPDVRVIGEEVPAEQGNRLGGETRLNLGERVHINAMGLDSDLRGSLLLRKRPGREPTAEGRISLVNGSFTAYGRKLAIREGVLTFTGPLNDPIVDVRAVRSIETIDGPVIAGIHLTGRAQNLTATVFSEPAMADADALSYLVVGRPLNQATEAESQDLSGAAVALGLRQANRLVDQVGQSIGLDQLSLTGDGGESTALVAGKQLNRRLYARYSYGVFSRLGSFLLRYRMTESLTLEAATGENHSIDVVYSVETQ